MDRTGLTATDRDVHYEKLLDLIARVIVRHYLQGQMRSNKSMPKPARRTRRRGTAKKD